ncbi:MAG: CoB--CoM heterodisulfide reductase iron-sulfur subunit B family protein [candidate division KSB1 bacterium]|nr:CoB--CoM heterodisulfide reductase iron-sulfur subunit B family protein [candidate division KSB1 bacterium]MDZ7294672.1 CoB--CoM heterodisulfide reductase iron-sulfur subunit B family protein [candidate division KSB1 bacterium]MDZ7386341.1 CoB--CoM heterodisulfide reductase iron-sulfur subunit B family protein [candidate division KSB1 bacterium]MDZ7393820.1 CoB--CoM heterodisulfide reductase iron-sulfur subunit B family protein [candidate division KSB1 bacterium]MDZ7412854.1 CoB--CoM heterod
MKLSYYPGCTLKDKTTHLDETTKASTRALGIELQELETWTCCGATYPLTEEKIANLIPQIRILRNVRQAGNEQVTTTCAFCYSTLKRANRAIALDPMRRQRVNAFLRDDEPVRPYKEKTETPGDYEGEVAVLHLLEVFRDQFGWDKLTKAVKKPLDGLKVAPYYGCKLLRPPKEMEFDDPENPTTFENFLSALGCEVVDFPFKSECCGSYLSLSAPDAASRVSYLILKSAIQNGAEVVALSCPLCYYNMDLRQRDIARLYAGFRQVPVLFFTQLLAVALGLDEKILGLERHYVDVRPILKQKNLIQ